MRITTTLATDLIKEQFPQWAHLAIIPITPSGWDNKMFRLGETMVIRLPSAKCYAAQVLKEQTWLPLLAPHLSLEIPIPLALGNPSKKYPWHWSIYRWISGYSANTLKSIDLLQIASGLAQFLRELQSIDTTGGPKPGKHNFFRGAHLKVYDTEARLAIAQVKDIFNKNELTALWEQALSSTWQHNPVWIHGDMSPGNILIQDSQLAAVIDFGCMAIGDPACDLVIAWTFFKEDSRHLFKSALQLDKDTWFRARGWALWKALITLNALDKKSPEAYTQITIIKQLLNA